MSRTLKTFVSGDKNAAETIVFLHGWPDSSALWDGVIAEFKSQYRCVSMQLPNFGDTVDDELGCDFEELSARVHKTVLEILRPNEKQVIVCCHDWGASVMYAFEKEHPELIKRMIAMDIGPHIKPNLYAYLLILTYQWTLVFAFILGRFIPSLGNLLTRAVAKFFRAPREAHEISWRLNYPYYYAWLGLFTGRGPFRPKKGSRVFPLCPMLFIYGEKKPIMFHSQKTIDVLNATPGSKAVGLSGGHWFMVSKTPQTVQLMKDFLNNKQ